MRLRERLSVAAGVLFGDRAALDRADLMRYEVETSSAGGRGGLQALFGARVSEEQAVSSATVYACIELIASSIAQMPVEVRRVGEGKQPLVHDVPFERLWNVRPNPLQSGVGLVESVITALLLRGNAYVWMQPAEIGEGPRALWLLDPDRVTVDTVEDAGGLRTVYIVGGGLDGHHRMSPAGQGQIVRSEDMLHFRGLLKDGLLGRSVLDTGARTASYLERIVSAFSALTYRKGAWQQFAITTERPMAPSEIKTFREQFEDSVGVGIDGVAMPIVVSGAGAAGFHQLSQSMRDLETSQIREFQISDVARAFHVPGILINQESKSTSWGTGVQATQQGFLTYGLMPHLARLEAEINAKLYPRGERRVVFREERLLRGTPRERYDNYARALGGGGQPGWKSVNEIRAQEGLSQLEGETYTLPYVPPAVAAMDENVRAPESGE